MDIEVFVWEIRDNEIFNKVVEDILTHEKEKKMIQEMLKYMSSNVDRWQT